MARKLSGSPESDNQSDSSIITSDANEANQASEENSTVSTTTETAPEAVVTPEPSDSDESVTEATEAAAPAEAEAKPEYDLSEFVSAVQAGIDSRDPSTGTVPEAQADAVKTAYQALPVGGKSKAKAHLLATMTEGVESGDLSTAMAASQLQKSLVPAKSSGTKAPSEPKAPADPNEAVANQLAILRTAFVHLKDNLPEGADPDAVSDKTAELASEAGEQLAGYIEWLQREPVEEGQDDTPEPEVSTVTKKAAKLVLTKVRVSTAGGGSGGNSYSGPRRSVATHITQVFADKAAGDFMSISEIANATSEEYGSDKVSSGAVSARLFPTEGDCSLTDVRPATVDGKRGAIKL